MKSAKKLMSLVLALLMTALLVCPVLSMPAEAAESLDMGFVYAIDSNDNIVNVTIGVPIVLNGKCSVLTEVSMRETDSQTAKYIFSHPTEGDFDMTPDVASENVTIFDLDTHDTSMCFDIGVPVANEECTLFYWETEDDTNFTDNTAPSEITELLGVDDGGMYMLGGSYEGNLDKAWYTMILVNDNSEVVAFYTENGLVSFEEPVGLDGAAPDTPHPDPDAEDEGETPARGSSDSDSSDKSGSKKSIKKFIPIVIILAVVAGAVVAIVLVLTHGKKKPAAPAPSVPQTPSVPQAPSAPQAPEVPQASAADDIVPTVPGTPGQASVSAQDASMFNGWQDMGSASVPQQARPLCPYVSWVAGPLAGQRYRLTQEVILIGRGEDAAIRLPADTKGVSRRHCQIIYRNGALTIVDLGSTSGTFIQGKGQLVPNQPVALREGDEIYLGSRNVEMKIIVK